MILLIHVNVHGYTEESLYNGHLWETILWAIIHYIVVYVEGLFYTHVH